MTPQTDPGETRPRLAELAGRLGRRVRGAVVDGGRMYGAALGLNLRKAWWIGRGRRGRVPCQAESDSGRVGETRCEASVHWQERRRFRRVCPHLRREPGGEWLCGVEGRELQVFWGRAAGWWLGGLAFLWLGLTLALWAGLWRTGVRVGYAEVVWPGGWTEIPRARARYYVDQAEEALAGRRYQEMQLALNAALRSDPRNLRARVRLADIAWAQGDHVLAGQGYAAMVEDFPEERPALARAWLPKLLVVGEYGRIAALAEEMLQRDPEARGAWVHALIFAAGRTRDAAVLERAAQLPGLPATLRDLFFAQAAGMHGDTAAARAQLAALATTGGQDALTAYQLLEGLLEYGAPAQVLALLERGVLQLPEQDRLYFRLWAGHQLGQTERTQRALRAAFQGIDLPRLNAIATYLVRCHDRAGLIAVRELLRQAPRAERLDGTLALLILAAELWGERDVLPGLMQLAGEKTPLSTSLLARVDRLMLRPENQRDAISLLPLPLDALYVVMDTLQAQAKVAAPR